MKRNISLDDEQYRFLQKYVQLHAQDTARKRHGPGRREMNCTTYRPAFDGHRHKRFADTLNGWPPCSPRRRLAIRRLASPRTRSRIVLLATPMTRLAHGVALHSQARSTPPTTTRRSPHGWSAASACCSKALAARRPSPPYKSRSGREGGACSARRLPKWTPLLAEHDLSVSPDTATSPPITSAIELALTAHVSPADDETGGRGNVRDASAGLGSRLRRPTARTQTPTASRLAPPPFSQRSSRASDASARQADNRSEQTLRRAPCPCYTDDELRAETSSARISELRRRARRASSFAAPSLLASGARAAGVPDGEVLTGSHWGAFRAKVEGGRFVSISAVGEGPGAEPSAAGVLDSVYSPTRIKYPMVRRAFLEKGPGADVDSRGSGDFVRVTWDQALDLVAKELKRVEKTYGPAATFAGSYGWKSPGRLHNCQSLLRRMMNLKGSFVNASGDYSTGAAQIIMPHVLGTLEVYEQQTVWPVVRRQHRTDGVLGRDPVADQPDQLGRSPTTALMQA